MSVQLFNASWSLDTKHISIWQFILRMQMSCSKNATLAGYIIINDIRGIIRTKRSNSFAEWWTTANKRWIRNSLAGNFAAFPITSLAALASALNYTTTAASGSNATRSTTCASFLLDATSVSLDACYLRQELFTLVCQYRPGKALRRQPFYGILTQNFWA